MDKYGRLKIIIPLGLIVIGFRFMWQSHPSLLFCYGFWISVCLWYIVLLTWKTFPIFIRSGWGVMAIGGCFNAVVTIANGGFMPTAGEATGVYIHGGLLTWLGDFYWAGMSPGDIIMLSGILLIFISIPFRLRREVA